MTINVVDATKKRHYYASEILNRIKQSQRELQQQFVTSHKINSFYIDDLLDADDARQIYNAFPDKSDMLQLKDIREHKYVGLKIDNYNPIIAEIIYAFQNSQVVSTIAEITGIKELFPDEYLYAGGISMMDNGCFLNPHLDNSHDKDRKNYRQLNLLYYVTPEWQPEYGGNLELWDNGLKQAFRTIDYKFNRLAVMITHNKSWHSVSKINYQGQRCCVSNYYFSPTPLTDKDYFHVTSFRGRPEQRLRDLILQGDGALRNGIRKVFKHGIRKPHYFDSKQDI